VHILCHLLKKYTHTSFMTRFLYNQATFSESRLGLNSSTIEHKQWLEAKFFQQVKLKLDCSCGMACSGYSVQKCSLSFSIGF